MNILWIKDLVLIRDGKRILDGVSLELEASKTYALVGPNGAGKSSLAYVLMGLDGYREIKGDIIFEGKSIKKLAVPVRAKLGLTLAWQEPARFQGLKVADFLKASAKGDMQAAAAALVRVGLAPEKYLLRAVDKTLSGGERKRIELASIICMQPKLVILDEPDSGVDVEAMSKIFGTIDYLKSTGTTILLITHNAQVLKRADAAYLLCEGKIIDQSSKADAGKYFKDRCLKCPRKDRKGGKI
jgi:Fe-S cluster assembly ATP-binding protein